MCARENAAVGSNQRPSTDVNHARIDDNGVEIQKDSFAQADICAVIYPYWGFDPGIVIE
jgi:hypothetical protein